MLFRLTSLTFLLLAAGSTFAKNHPSVEQGASAIHLMAKFRQWVTEYGKKYSSEAEEILRLKVWAANHGTLLACLLAYGLGGGVRPFRIVHFGV